MSCENCGADEPTKEEYRRIALRGAGNEISEQKIQLENHLGALEHKLRRGKNPTPEDIHQLLWQFTETTEVLLGTLEPVTVGDEAEIVKELRNIYTDFGTVLTVAKNLHEGNTSKRDEMLDIAEYAHCLLSELRERDAIRGFSEPGEEIDPHALDDVAESAHNRLREDGGENDE